MEERIMTIGRTLWQSAIGFIAAAVLCGAAQAQSVVISIKPNAGSTNTINPTSRGVIPVAILGSDTFDVGLVDDSTLLFGPRRSATGLGAMAERSAVEDVNDDGFDDLISHYPTEDTGFFNSDTLGCVTGQSVAGTFFEGCDGVRVVNACGLGFELGLLLPPLFWLRAKRGRRFLP
jgi:hypothetical protein